MTTHEPRELSVLSYNIWVRPWFLLNGRAARIERLVAPLRGYDVVVLQEAFAPAHCQRLFDALGECYPYQTGILGGTSLPWPLGPGLKLWNGGVAILSRWPITRQDRRSFRQCLAPVDRWSDKGVLYARLDKDGQPYHVFGTHTQAEPEGYVRRLYGALGRDVDAAFLATRHENFDVIRRFVGSLRIPADEPVILAGDMNTDRLRRPAAFAEMLRRLHAGFPAELAGHHCTIDPTGNALASAVGDEWLDYVLWSRDHLEPTQSRLEAKVFRADVPWSRHPLDGAYRDLSDHYAVAARLRFPDPAS